ncbi:Myb-like dna-binding protein [Globisporangium polare]
MTITSRVQSEFFEREQHQERLIRIAPHQGRAGRSSSPSSSQPTAPNGSNSSWGLSWTDDEHNRFLEAMELFPSGPWKVIANYVGTKTPRQTMTHAQKYRQKIARRKRGLKTTSKQSEEDHSQPQSPPQLHNQFTAMPASPPPYNAVPNNGTISHQYVPILPWSALTTPQMVMQEHREFVLDAAPVSATLFESDDDFAQFLLEDYEPLLFSDDFDASLEDEMEISRILAECGW